MEKKSVKENYLLVKEHLKANPSATVISSLKKFGISCGSYYTYSRKDRKGELAAVKKKKKRTVIKKTNVTALVPHSIEYLEPVRPRMSTKNDRVMVIVGSADVIAQILKAGF